MVLDAYIKRGKRNETQKNLVRPVFLPSRTTMYQGTLMLADISGFTRFVKKMDPLVGVPIIRELLETIIQQNKSGFTVNEIEGDAVLFYKAGAALPLEETVRQFEKMSAGFHEKLRKFSPLLYGHDLQIKVIVHYGLFSTYQIGGFTKLYGTAVIEAHRLLKNSIDQKHYLLVTKQYMEAVGERNDGRYHFHRCEMYDDIGSICYRVIQPVLVDRGLSKQPVPFSHFGNQEQADEVMAS